MGRPLIDLFLCLLFYFDPNRVFSFSDLFQISFNSFESISDYERRISILLFYIFNIGFLVAFGVVIHQAMQIKIRTIVRIRPRARKKFEYSSKKIIRWAERRIRFDHMKSLCEYHTSDTSLTYSQYSTMAAKMYTTKLTLQHTKTVAHISSRLETSFFGVLYVINLFDSLKAQ